MIYSWKRYGRAKQFERYPKPPLLDKKWGNCDINVLEQTKIPQFIGIPLRLFESLFVNMLDDMIDGYTELYGHREKADTSIKNF